MGFLEEAIASNRMKQGLTGDRGRKRGKK